MVKPDDLRFPSISVITSGSSDDFKKNRYQGNYKKHMDNVSCLVTKISNGPYDDQDYSDDV